MTNLKKADKNLIKKINMASIMDVVRSEGDISRANIAKSLGLNSATVSNNVSDLIEQGYLKETGAGVSSGGRKPILLTLDTDQIFIIGIYVGIKRIEMGLMDLKGNIIEKVSFDTFEYGRVIDYIVKGVDDLLTLSNLSKDAIEGVGVGYHGIVDSDKGISLFAPAFQTKKLDVKSELEKRLEIKVAIDNDVRVMAMGEKFFGKAKAYSDFVIINMDVGIGSGIFIGDKIYHGTNFGAGEIGHVKLTQEPIPCRCGKSGCFEAICSISGIENRFLELSGEKLDFNLFIEKLNAGNLTCKKLLEDVIMYSKEAFEIVINFLNPESIILTGRIIDLLPPVEEIMEQLINESIDNNAKDFKLHKSEIEDLRIVGSASLIYYKIFKVN